MVSLKSLRNFFSPQMRLGEQRMIVAGLDEQSAETKKLEAIYQQKLTALGQLKKSILHQAFTGQLQ